MLSFRRLIVQLCLLPCFPSFAFSSGIFMSTCNVDVRWFPFDIQKCELKFGSWTYDGWLLDLQMNDADISGFMPNGEWDLVGEYRAKPPDCITHQNHPVTEHTSRSLSAAFQEFPAPETRPSTTVVRSRTPMWHLLWQYAGERSTMPWICSSPVCCFLLWLCSSLCCQPTLGRRSRWVSWSKQAIGVETVAWRHRRPGQKDKGGREKVGLLV